MDGKLLLPLAAPNPLVWTFCVQSNLALMGELKQYGAESTQAAVRAMVTDLVPKVTQAVTGSVTGEGKVASGMGLTQREAPGLLCSSTNTITN